MSFCDCALQPQAAPPAGASALADFGSKVRITNLKTFGVTIPGAPPDRPYVFVKLETDAGLVGWGEGTLEGKAGAVMACINDFREFLIGADPMPVEHHWQSMYVHSFLPRRSGDGLRDLRASIRRCGICAARSWVSLCTSCSADPTIRDGVRGYYVANARTLDDLQRLRETAQAQGNHGLQRRSAELLRMDRDQPEDQRGDCVTCRCCAKGLGPDIDIAVDFHAKTSPTRGVGDHQGTRPAATALGGGTVPA